jgi:hypothetical protein
MKERAKNYLLFIACALLIFSGFFNYKLSKINRYYQQLLPYLVPGERISSFKLLGASENIPDLKELDEAAIQVIYIFSQPCTPCDKNMIFLKKFSRLLDRSVIIRGIIVGNLSEGYDFARKAELDFNVYVPENLDQFKKEFRLKFSYSQLIICRGREIVFVKIGELSSDEFGTILELIRNIE